MWIRAGAIWFAAMLWVSGFELPSSSSQCLLGIAEDWNSPHVTLSLYQKSGEGWQRVGDTWKARLGKNGLAWGLGLHAVPRGAKFKQEGDLRSPVGVFAIGGVWGYDRSIEKHRDMPYRRVTPRDLWVEDVESKMYNQHVVLDHDPQTAWEKKQQMKQSDPAHALKLFIAHNAPPKVMKGAGSSIFFHIWRDGGGRPTAGCTAMDERKLRWLISKIDPSSKPVYVLLPKAEYEKRKKDWGLP